jgi:hypothetical protein
MLTPSSSVGLQTSVSILPSLKAFSRFARSAWSNLSGVLLGDQPARHVGGVEAFVITVRIDGGRFQIVSAA